MVSHVQVPALQGKEIAFIEGKRKLEGCSKQRVKGFSLAESLPGEKRSPSSSCWALLSLQGVRAPPTGLPTLFNCGFCLLIFLQKQPKFPLMVEYINKRGMFTQWNTLSSANEPMIATCK